MHLSVNTVRTHMQSLMAKLGVHSALEAVAVTRSWLDVPPPKESPPMGGSPERRGIKGGQSWVVTTAA